MRCLLILLCLMFATSVANAQRPILRPLTATEPLPEAVQKMPMEVYSQWAIWHNQLSLHAAYAKNDRRTYNIPPTTVTTKRFREYSTATGGRGFFSLPTHYDSNRSERTITRTYSHNTWSGGPVLLINPYFRN